MPFLLTNDDGIDAPGLAALRRAVETLGSAITLAPDRHLSGCSHQATTDRGLHLIRVAEGAYSLDGSPVDCTRVGLTHVMPECDWVLSGINEGGNLGADVYLSGTVAAAREACILGRRAIAVSQYFPKRPIHWDSSAQMARRAIAMLLEHATSAGVFWNVNLPQTALDGSGAESPEIVFCSVDGNPLPAEYELREGLLHYRGRYHQRLRTEGRDVAECFAGKITISEIRL